MKFDFFGFYNGREAELEEVLRLTSPAYALAWEREKTLRSELADILTCDTQCNLTPGDFTALREYLDATSGRTALEKRAYYTQGCKDCAAFLKELGLL